VLSSIDGFPGPSDVDAGSDVSDVDAGSDVSGEAAGNDVIAVAGARPASGTLCQDCGNFVEMDAECGEVVCQHCGATIRCGRPQDEDGARGPERMDDIAVE
jgi:hypothetical protein